MWFDQDCCFFLEVSLLRLHHEGFNSYFSPLRLLGLISSRLSGLVWKTQQDTPASPVRGGVSLVWRLDFLGLSGSHVWTLGLWCWRLCEFILSIVRSPLTEVGWNMIYPCPNSFFKTSTLVTTHLLSLNLMSIIRNRGLHTMQLV